MRLRTLGALVTVLCLLGISGVRSDAAPKPGGTMKVALLRDPTGWDPHINYGATTYTFQANIYEGLLRYSLKGALEPGLAVRWETPNPTTYVLHLRKGVKFHSGNPFTADDVKWNIERIMAPATNATRAKEFEVVEAVSVVDPSTVADHAQAARRALPRAPRRRRGRDRGQQVGHQRRRRPQEGGQRHRAVQARPVRDRRPVLPGQAPRLLGVAVSLPRPDRAVDGGQGRRQGPGADDGQRRPRRVHPLAGGQGAREGPADQGPRGLRHLQRDPHEPEAPALRQREGPAGPQLPRRPEGDHRAGLGRHRAPVRRRAHPRGPLGVPQGPPGNLVLRSRQGEAPAHRGGREPRRHQDRVRLDHALGPHGLGSDHRHPAPAGGLHADRAEADGRADPAAEARLRRVPDDDGRVQPPLA